MSLPLENIETFTVRLPTRADFRWNGLERPLGEILIVKLTSGNAIGYGETVPLPDWSGPHGSPSGETPAIDELVLHELVAPRILGRDAEQPAIIRTQAEAAVRGYPYALAALDIAMHDLVARDRNLPIFDLLGGRRRAAVPIAHMIGLAGVEAAQGEAEAALEEGCHAFQVKGGQDIRRDVMLVRRLRALVPPEVVLRVDANCGYGTPKDAIAAVARLADAGANMVEQPVGDLEALRKVAAKSPIPVVGDEACWSPADAIAAVCHEAVDALSVYVAKAGGMASAAAMTQIAAAAGLPHDMNGSLEGGIGNAASLHVAAVSDAELLPSVLPISGPEGDQPTNTFGRYFADEVIAAGMPTRDGAVMVPDAPGLGIDVDESKLISLAIRHRSTNVDKCNQQSDHDCPA